ncbi:MAG TPA: hypothetical protein VD790_10255 [Thermoleophilaceae bacterium]|nr:hypothetical protein [Thermoleophilaceae bacterium]
MTALDARLTTAERESRSLRRIAATLRVEIEQLPTDSSLRDSLARCLTDLEEGVS